MTLQRGSRTNGSGQNGPDKMVYGQNGIGQNGMDKMARTKWYGKNITDKSSINPVPIDNIIFFINPASILMPLAFPYVLIILFVIFGY